MYHRNNYSDVVMVGTGMAGLNAATSTAMQYPQLKVTIITAPEMGSGDCSKRTHGINAALNNGDKQEIHVRDTIFGGDYINQLELVHALCDDVVQRVKELEAWGVRFDKNKVGEYDVGTYGGSTYRRSDHRNDITGLEVMNELEKRLNCCPTAHFLMGGMMISPYCETKISGLYACGEDAGGSHGGNRLGGNGAADVLVFGYRAGQAAGEFALRASDVLDSLPASTKVRYYQKSKSDCTRIAKEVKEIMWKKVGLVPSQKELTEANDALTRIAHSLEAHGNDMDLSQETYDLNILSCIELYYKLQLARMITRSALARKNSVGAHHVVDGCDATATYNIVTQMGAAGDIMLSRAAAAN